ncbi:MAG: cytoplasmic protein [Comamonadaceae bacterium CG12_big_fil_rev_8_21_14_0_65_59_15]|nr:MAG: cytoplasmic protein [Comamonadaceae bacterium CG12_big_fil_rev_8_21_14_0_65_59_15]
MTLSLEERLNQILPRITSRDFLDSKGLGNEIGFWVFDYPAERELDVRDFFAGTILPALSKHVPPIQTGTVDLLQLVTGLLEERKLLDKTLAMQQTKGDDSTLAALRSVLKEDKLAQKVASQFDIAALDLLILTGVGAVYPMLRTHTLLSALHPIMGNTPLLMFFPGRYDGHSLRLFNMLAEDHYYRAFRLVPETA